MHHQRAGNWQQPHNSIESPEAVFSPQNQNSVPPYGGGQSQAAYEAQQAAAAHQQQQRGVNQLTNAVATLGVPRGNALTPVPGQTGMNGAGGQQGMEKRGPVEFNHAISYVNKIKVRGELILGIRLRALLADNIHFLESLSGSTRNLQAIP